MRLPWYPCKKPVEVLDTTKSEVVGHADFAGGRHEATIALECRTWDPLDQLFIKSGRYFGFFDEAGWREVPVHEG